MSTTTPTTVLPLEPGRWALDPFHTRVGFVVRRLGFSKVRGEFADVDVEVVVGDTLEATSVVATIDLASVDTGQPDRDAHLRSPDFLDVEARPTAVFRSTSISVDGDEWRIAGDLTIGEVTAPVVLAAELTGVNDFPPDGSRHASFEATTEIRRKDHGLGFGALGAAVGDVIKVELDVELVAPPGDAP